MKSKWSLKTLLGSVNKDVETRLGIARHGIEHPTDKGDASEGIWLELLNVYLPKRYEARRAHVVDSRDEFSEQIDIVVHDRQYSPFVWSFGGVDVVPAESVYAVLEAKQVLNANNVEYAQGKVASVRRLHRTSLTIPTANGLVGPKPLHHILGGIVSLDSEWSPAMGQPLLDKLSTKDDGRIIDIGCVVSAGIFERTFDDTLVLSLGEHAGARFLLTLVAKLQEIATVPMMDVRAYAAWLGK